MTITEFLAKSNVTLAELRAEVAGVEGTEVHECPECGEHLEFEPGTAAIRLLRNMLDAAVAEAINP